jgi:hypothetical protein
MKLIELTHGGILPAPSSSCQDRRGRKRIPPPLIEETGPAGQTDNRSKCHPGNGELSLSGGAQQRIRRRSPVRRYRSRPRRRLRSSASLSYHSKNPVHCTPRKPC